MGGLWPAPNFSSSLTPAIRPPLAVARFLAGVERERDNRSPSAPDPFGIREGSNRRYLSVSDDAKAKQPSPPHRSARAARRAPAPGAYKASSSVGHISFPEKRREFRNARLSRSLGSFSFRRNLAAQNAKRPVSKPAARRYGLGASEAIRFPVSRSRFHRARSAVYCAS